MSSQADENQGVIFGVVFGVIALVIALIFGVINYQKGVKQAALEQTTAAAVVPVAPSADAASVVVEGGVVKFYFASGKSELATGANEALVAVVAGAAGDKKAVVSGFNDATGDAAKNAELSKMRAFAVRDALVHLGVAQERIELRKPADTTVEGPAEQARRVEVTLE